MILDTGAPVMLIPDTTLARELGLRVLGRANVGGAGDDAPRSAPIAGNIRLSLGGLEVKGALAVLGIGGDVILGVDGVVGAAVFQHAAVTIDWDAREVRLQVPSRYRPVASAEVLSLEVRSSLHASIKGELDPDGRGAVPVSLHLDTGARMALNVYRTNFAAAERIPTPVRGDEALLGIPVLRRFRVTIDYAGGRLALEPTARIAEPFHYSALGATYRPAAEGAGARIIASIIPGSPAEAAGLAVGDSVVTVNGKAVGRHDG